MDVSHRLDAIGDTNVQVRTVLVDLRIEDVEVGERDGICHRYEPARIAFDDLSGLVIDPSLQMIGWEVSEPPILLTVYQSPQSLFDPFIAFVGAGTATVAAVVMLRFVLAL